MTGIQPELPCVDGFAPEMQGRLAECDGGAPIAGTNYAGRQEFAGRLTGHYRDFLSGDQQQYAWRWYLMGELTKKPEGYALEAVWCDADSLFMAD
jgi:hypothetical protein